MTSLERYLALGHRIGCPRDQMDNFVAAGVVLQERQLAASAAARLCDRPDGPTAVGYGGARGGGKSHWLLAQMGADDCQRVPGLKCLLLRKVGEGAAAGAGSSPEGDNPNGKRERGAQPSEVGFCTAQLSLGVEGQHSKIDLAGPDAGLNCS